TLGPRFLSADANRSSQGVITQLAASPRATPPKMTGVRNGKTFNLAATHIAQRTPRIPQQMGRSTRQHTKYSDCRALSRTELAFWLGTCCSGNRRNVSKA